jgi:hypothetical protein
MSVFAQRASLLISAGTLIHLKPGWVFSNSEMGIGIALSPMFGGRYLITAIRPSASFRRSRLDRSSRGCGFYLILDQSSLADVEIFPA